MPSFGEKLKQGREKRNITLEQISATTKISTRMLQALEEDRFNQLPGGIFNKGFVRAYARCVGLDEDQMVAEYLQASGDLPPALSEIAPREDSPRENAARVSRLEASNSDDAVAMQLPWGWFAAALLLTALVLSFWNHRRQEAKQLVRAAAVNSAPRSAGVPGGGPDGVQRETAPAAPAIVPAASRLVAVAHSSAAPDEFQVTIHAREPSWISTTFDGQASSSEILDAGSDRTFRGHEEIVVKVGNSGGVDFRFNGKTVEIGGEIGQVKTVTFGPLGLLPKAPPAP